MNKTSHPYLIPNGESRRDTAVLLVGTADEFGIDQRNIRMVRGGFRISQAMADALDLDIDGDSDETVEPVTAEVSGNEPNEPDEDPDEDSDEDPDEDPEPVAYDEWDYADLKAEVAKRDLDTEDKKSDTLVAALVADDQINNASGNRAEKNTAEQE